MQYLYVFNIVTLGLVSVEHRHIVWQINGQFNQSCHVASVVIPRRLVQQLMLAVADDLVSVAFARLYHVANHLVGRFGVAVVEILAYDVAVALDGPLVLIEHCALFVAHRGGEIGCLQIVCY